MKRFITLTLVAALAMCAWTATNAAPPYDVDVTVTAPTTGGQVDHYVLYLDNVAVASTARSPVLADGNNIAAGLNSYPGLLTADGTYTFEVGAVNAAGETLSAPVTVTVSEIALPGQPGVEIQVHCDPCVLTVN